jgi:diguanylate cyclase (GGDEF)-like protein/PAS domain S-box-containing protein
MDHRGGVTAPRWSWLLPHVPVPVGLVAFWAGDRLDLIADTPYWILATFLLVSSVLNASGLALTRRLSSRRARVHVRLAISTLSTTPIVYATGWGPLLTIGYAVGVADVLRSEGSLAWRPGLVWSALGLGAGQGAIALGIAPTLIEARVAHFVVLGGVACMAVVVRILGVTASAAEQAVADLEIREEQFRSLVQHASDVIGVVDRDGTVVYVSPAITGLLGYEPDACIGRPIDVVLEPPDRERLATLQVGLHEPGTTETVDLRCSHADGTTRLARVTATRRPDGHLVLNVHDITQQRALEEELTYQARHDALTGLLNRGALMGTLDEICDEARRRDDQVAVLFVDLDGFKAVNDRYGHEQGDLLLIEAAHRIASCLRPSDRVGRLGGDEFLVLLPGVNDPAVARRIADRVLAALAAPWPPYDDCTITGSIGIATTTSNRETVDELVRRADGAMYEAKRLGRRQAVVAA